MMIVAALVITVSGSPEHLVFNATIAVMAMQLFITYIWWSVGIYDKEHRKLNTPYTVFYLTSFALMFLTLFLQQPYIRIVFYIALLLNYLPPFLSFFTMRKRAIEFNLSSSMTERLGLFTIIIFGEVVLGIVNGVIDLNLLNLDIWLCFGLALLIVFALWWLFFTLISDRPCKKGIIKSSLMELVYVPNLMALGIIAVSFSGLFQSFLPVQNIPMNLVKMGFGISMSVFICGIALLLSLLEYPPHYLAFKKKIQQLLFASIVLLLTITFAELQLSLFAYLFIILSILLILIGLLNMIWYTRMSKQKEK